ncbi:type II secretion system protein [Pseudothermotoga sp. U03pept]|uniref:type II secretion system protein n=1 Tax=Pseudothermotoga sp. U03pept TaxID=3447012 RepID=UPI003F1070A1
MKKAFTLLELIIAIAIFTSFLIVLILVLNNYLDKAQKNILLLDAFRRLSETADRVIEYLTKAAGPTTSVKVESPTKVSFDIILYGQKINAAVEVVDTRQFKYYENEQVQTIPVENVVVRFAKAVPASEIDLPLRVIVSTPNPFNATSTLSMEFTVYPPGVR